MEPVNEGRKSKAHVSIDRVVLEKRSVEVIESHQAALNEKFGDLVSVSQKQMVNFILQSRGAELTEAELSQIKEQFADKVKLLQAIVEKAKQARKEGREISLEEELKVLHAVDLPKTARRSGSRGRKKQTPSTESTDTISIDE